MTIGQAVDWPLFCDECGRGMLSCRSRNRATIRKIRCRLLRFKRFSGTLSTYGTKVFGDFPLLRLELWERKLRLRSSHERAWCPLCADGLS